MMLNVHRNHQAYLRRGEGRGKGGIVVCFGCETECTETWNICRVFGLKITSRGLGAANTRHSSTSAPIRT